jgi:hypothetical protein
LQLSIAHGGQSRETIALYLSKGSAPESSPQGQAPL